jgi:hypothetical protein
MRFLSRSSPSHSKRSSAEALRPTLRAGHDRNVDAKSSKSDLGQSQRLRRMLIRVWPNSDGRRRLPLRRCQGQTGHQTRPDPRPLIYEYMPYIDRLKLRVTDRDALVSKNLIRLGGVASSGRIIA